MAFLPIFSFGQTWDYPVKPGTEEWRALKTHDEKVATCQIPIGILRQISTNDLLEICLNYPLTFDFYAYKSLKEGIIEVVGRFNGLKELFAREDNFSVILKYIDIQLLQVKIESATGVQQKGKAIHEYTLMESLLSFDAFIDNATPGEITYLNSKILNILDYKLDKKKIFSDYASSASALLLGKLLKKTNPDIKFSDNTELFIETGIANNSGIFIEIKSKALR